MIVQLIATVLFKYDTPRDASISKNTEHEYLHNRLISPIYTLAFELLANTTSTLPVFCRRLFSMQVEVLFIKIECIVVPRRTPGHRVFRFTSKLEFCFVAWGAHADRYDRAVSYTHLTLPTTPYV